MEPLSSRSTMLKSTVYVLGAAAFLASLAYNIIGITSAGAQNNIVDKKTIDTPDSVASLPQSAASEGTNRRLEKRIASLNNRQNELEDDLIRIEDRVEADNIASEGESGVDLSEEEKARAAEAQYEKQVNLLEETLDDERADPEWSNSAVEKLAVALSDSGVLRNFNSRCQSTMCRVDMEFADQYRSEEDFRHLSDTLPWDGMMFFKIFDEGKQGTVYLAREGHKLPRVGM